MCASLLFTEFVSCLLLVGACAAGIVGHKIPHYSVFGENVKMADRMCHSSPGKKDHCNSNLVDHDLYRMIILVHDFQIKLEKSKSAV